MSKPNIVTRQPPLPMRHVYLFLLLLLGLSQQGQAQLSGRLWQDVNANGRADTHEPPVGSMRVKAYGTAGHLLGETTTDRQGNYHLPLPAGERIRLEFGALPQGLVPAPGQAIVRFLTTPAEASLGLLAPARFTGPGARAVQAVYVNGSYTDPAADTLTALVLFAAHQPKGSPRRLASPRQVGSLWGLAYDRVHRRLFAAAVAKRHSAFGPLGPGGLYLVQPDSGTVRPFLSLDALDIPTAPKSLPRDLPGSLTAFSHDSLLFSLAGKISLGGLDVSGDGRALYVTNLYDRKLYRIALPTGEGTPTKSDVTSYVLPNPGCAGGTFRPFAVKVHAGRVYIGGVCEAATSDRSADLRAIVYALDEVGEKSTNPPFTEVFSTRLDYPRGVLDYGISGWQAWTDDYRRASVPQAPNWLIRPQPILADIEFDTDGSMILGLMDRLGHQTADGQYVRPTGSRQLQQYRGLSGGDVLRVAYVPTSEGQGRYELERNGRADGQATQGRNTRQGPEGGEYYFDDAFRGAGRTWHGETATGGLALLPETGQLLVATREPEADRYVTGGVRWFSNQTGQATGAYAVFPGGERAGYVWKANSVGDVEIIPDLPLVEVGNRVWFDRNQNGTQDADEPGLADVELHLYRDGKQLATTRTDAEGQYRFTHADVKGGIQAKTPYEIRFALREGAYGDLRIPTPSASRAVPKTDWPGQIDNDATAQTDQSVIAFTTAGPGESRQDLDAGVWSEALNRTNSDETSVRLTPNPASDQVEVVYRGQRATGPIKLQLLTVEGRLLQSHEGALREGVYRQTLDITTLPPGVYQVVVTEAATPTTARLVKK